jgi:hypothetical protein
MGVPDRGYVNYIPIPDPTVGWMIGNLLVLVWGAYSIGRPAPLAEQGDTA